MGVVPDMTCSDGWVVAARMEKTRLAEEIGRYFSLQT